MINLHYSSVTWFLLKYADLLLSALKSSWEVCEVLITHHYSLQNLSGDGGQHSLIIVLSDAGENPRQLSSDRPEEDPQRDVDILQIWEGQRHTIEQFR